MMKKWLALLLCLALTLGLAQSALALDLTLECNPVTDGPVPEPAPDAMTPFWPSSIAVAGDTLYVTGDIAGQGNTGLYRWQEGMTEAEPVTRIISASRFSSLEDMESYRGTEVLPEGTDTDHLFGLLVSDGERLISYNPLNGLVFAVNVGEDGVTFTDLCTMSSTDLLYHAEEEWRYLLNPQGAAIAAGHMAMCINDYGAEGELYYVVDVDLATGEVKKAQIDYARQLSAYKDGKLLISAQNWEEAWDEENNRLRPADLLLYDPLTGEAQKAGEIESNAATGFTYIPSLDVVAYTNNNRIMASSDLTNYSQYGFAPVSWSRSNCAWRDSLVMIDDNNVVFRTLTANYSTEDYLTAYNVWNDSGTKLFFSRYPQVPLYATDDYYGTMEQLSQAMVGGENSLDVLRVGISYNNFADLMKKGYCADLSGDQRVADYVNSLNPIYRDAVMKDGRIYAIPVNAYSYDGWFVSKEVMTQMGLTLEDLPTNIVDLCAFAQKWNNEWVDEYPQFSLMEYTEDYKQALFRKVLDEYLDQCVADGKEVDLNDPAFRQAAEAVDHLQVEKLNKGAQTPNEDEEGYRQGLFLQDYSLVGDFSSLQENEYRTFVPMSLTKDSPFRTGVYLDVLFVNPRTAHMESALNLLSCVIEAMDESNRHVLVSSATDPVENKYYDQWLTSEETYLNELRSQLETVDASEKKDYEEMIRSEEEYFEQMKESTRYDIPPEAIAAYHDMILPAAYVRQYNRFTSDEAGSSELNQLIERYLGGQMSLDQFIRDANGKLMMMQMENY